MTRGCHFRGNNRGKSAGIIKAFIFDLDGVLTDTAENHYLAWKRLADEENIPFSRQENEKLRGVSRRASLELILNGRHLEESKIQELMERKNGYYRSYLEQISEDDLLPGALDLLDELRKRNFLLALASASKNANYVVKRLGIEPYFSVIADGNSVKRAKPEPDLFLFVAVKFNLPPEQCLVVEDAEAGVEAAKAAGMKVIGIGPTERVGAADYIYPSVKKITLADFLCD